MTKLESIRKIFVPPIIATVIAIGLVSYWTPAEASFDQKVEVIDLGNTTVRFQVRFLGMARVIGYFDRFIGKLMHDPASETGSVDMHIDVSSINTSDDARDEFLRGPTFFNAERYPQITFTNSQLIYGEDGLEQISGDLSMHGMTRTVIFEVEPVDPDKGDHSGEIQAKVTINRSDYGLNSMTPFISNEVEIVIAMQANS
jgi:polyisoprenoid-binding protein YceI